MASKDLRDFFRKPKRRRVEEPVILPPTASEEAAALTSSPGQNTDESTSPRSNEVDRSLNSNSSSESARTQTSETAPTPSDKESPRATTDPIIPVNTDLATRPSVGTLMTGPNQPLDRIYPRNTSLSIKKTIRFQSSWFKRHPWIGYDVEKEMVFCFPCIHFNTGLSGCSDTVLTVDGYNRWDKAIGDKRKGLDLHASSKSHLEACQKWDQYKANPVKIADRLVPSRSQVIESNREYFDILLKAMRYIILQGLAYRHRDENDTDAINRGNFAELVQLMLETNDRFKQLRSLIMQQYSIHVDYTSKEIFNQIIKIMADHVRSKIAEEMRQAGMYTLMLDESKDAADHEQLAVCVR